jgi:hypothetical protein
MCYNPHKDQKNWIGNYGLESQANIRLNLKIFKWIYKAKN